MSKDVQEQVNRLNQEAYQLFQSGQGEKAIEIATQSYNLAVQFLGEDHPTSVIALGFLAKLYRATSNHAAAEPLYRKLLELQRRVLGEDHPSVAESLTYLSRLYQARGDYIAAEPLYRKLLEIQRKVLGEDAPEVPASMNSLAELYRELGNYAAAEPLYKQALALLQRKGAVENDLAIATIQNNLGLLYVSIGNYDKAEPLLRQSLKSTITALGENHPEVATSADNLATLYGFMKDYRQAEELNQQALEIYRATVGENNIEFARSIGNRALLYQDMGKYTDAEPLYRKALEITRKVVGEEHPDFATSLRNLAFLYMLMGRYTEAEPLYKQALEITRRVVGEEHPDYVINLGNLAELYAATKREGEALSLLNQCADIEERLLGQVFSTGYENQRMMYLEKIRGHFDRYLSLVLQYYSHNPIAAQAGMTFVLRRKALTAESLIAQRNAVLAGRYPELTSKWRELAILRSKIVWSTLEGASPEGVPFYYQLSFKDLSEQKERLEDELARQTPAMDLTQYLRTINLHTVAEVLPKNTMLIEFVRFSVLDFKAVGEVASQPDHYVAFVLRAGDPDNVRLIDLGLAGHIDRLIVTFRESITGEMESRIFEDSPSEQTSTSPASITISDEKTELRHIQAVPITSRGATNGGEGTALRAAIFDPLVDALAGCNRLYLVPDGELNSLPFEILPMSDGSCLLEQYHLSYLSTGRDALHIGKPIGGVPSAPVVVANPDFNLGAISLAGKAEPGSVEQRKDTPGRFPPLTGTQLEGEQVARLLGVEPLTQQSALKSVLMACRSPHILHIATHGFFLPYMMPPTEEHMQAYGFFIDREPSYSLGIKVKNRRDRLSLLMQARNPLLRSGLALAGVNVWCDGDQPPAEAENGILTAEDVMNLDLLNTGLVVLSACETGLGEGVGGEGVFGLRRAFVLAGAKTLVMSLWKVPDRQTQELMEDFYRRLLSSQSRSEALREAQLALKENYPQPYYWGAFICQGDPGPLAQL